MREPSTGRTSVNRHAVSAIPAPKVSQEQGIGGSKEAVYEREPSTDSPEWQLTSLGMS